MKLEDLKKIESKISSHRNNAVKLKRDAETVADIRRCEPGKFIAMVGTEASTYCIKLSSKVRENSYSTQDRDAAFQRAWERYGASILRTVEMDLLHQARRETVEADILQGQLDRMLSAAAEVGGIRSRDD